jgi:hypothetical protein
VVCSRLFAKPLETLLKIPCVADVQLSALLTEVAAMRACNPPRKAVVLSSWSRLLQLVEDALNSNGIGTARFWGPGSAARAVALRRFRTDPMCTVILVVMSNSGRYQFLLYLYFCICICISVFPNLYLYFCICISSVSF